MDLTSLSSTLPNDPRTGAASAENDYPTAALMAQFKQAALSVTTLYRTAHSELDRSRMLGYQECLEDLLHLLNSERIHRNSETVKIREWALSKRRRGHSGTRRNNRGRRHSSSSPVVDESEDEKSRSQTMGSSSPVIHSDPSQSNHNHHIPSVPPSAPPSRRTTPTPTSFSPQQGYRTLPKTNSSGFTFRSNHRLPGHPPPPPNHQEALTPSEDTELTDPPPDSPIPTPLAEQAPHQFNAAVAPLPPAAQRSTSGAWKRRLPYDFLEIAAMAEKEKAAYGGGEFQGNKRGRFS